MTATATRSTTTSSAGDAKQRRVRGRFVFEDERWTHSVALLAMAVGGVSAVHTHGRALVDAWLARGLDGERLVVVVGFSFYFAVFWCVAACYLALDAACARWPAAPLCRWALGRRIQPENTLRRPSLPAAVAVVVRNQLLGTAPALFVLASAMRARGVLERDALLALPSPSTMAAQLVAMVVVEDVLFHCVHRALHTPALYARVHKQHHDYVASIAIVTHYVSFVEHALGNLLPVFAGVVVVGAHPLLAFVWTAIAVVTAIHTHSNYAFALMPYPHYHDFHHYNSDGNFGVGLALLDKLFGSDRAWRALVQRERAAAAAATTSK